MTTRRIKKEYVKALQGRKFDAQLADQGAKFFMNRDGGCYMPSLFRTIDLDNLKVVSGGPLVCVGTFEIEIL